MSKVQFIIKASNQELNEKTSAILVEVAKKDFIEASEIRENLPEFSGPSINSNIGVLVKKEYIEKSGDGFILSELGESILDKAGELYLLENPTKRKSRAKGPTQDMADMNEYVLELIPEDLVKKVVINRSNYEVHIHRTNSLRSFEVRRKGIIRACCYMIGSDKLERCKELEGVSFRGTSPNTFVDLPATNENIEKLLSVFLLNK